MKKEVKIEVSDDELMQMWLEIKKQLEKIEKEMSKRGFWDETDS